MKEGQKEVRGWQEEEEGKRKRREWKGKVVVEGWKDKKAGTVSKRIRAKGGRGKRKKKNQRN